MLLYYVSPLEIIIDLPIGFPTNNIISLCRLKNMLFKKLYVVQRYMSFKSICRLRIYVV